MAKALKMASVGPVMVTMRSGQLPSEMLMRAPLWWQERGRRASDKARRCQRRANLSTYVFTHFLHSFSLLKADGNTSENLSGHAGAAATAALTFPMMLPTSCRDRKRAFKQQRSRQEVDIGPVLPFRASGA